MKKLRELSNERVQLLIYCSAAALMFLLAALLPLRYREHAEQETSGLSVGERAAIFSAYWNEPDGSRVTLENSGNWTQQEKEACDQRMTELVEQCSLDQQRGVAKKEGSEFFVLKAKSGQVDVCRKWIEWQGDWRNWLDVCFDADTGELYYLYLSAECLANYKSYTAALPAEFGAAYVAEQLGDRLDYELLYLDVPDDDPNSIIAAYHCGNSALRLRIHCVYHESVLVDVTISSEM